MSNRKKERYFLLLITVLFTLMFIRLYVIVSADFDDVKNRISKGTVLNVNAPDAYKGMKEMLQKGNYFTDDQDIDLAARMFAKGMANSAGALDNIGELNKKRFSVAVNEAFIHGGETFKKRAKVERSVIGFTGSDSSLFVSEKKTPMKVPSQMNLSLGTVSVTGTIVDKVNHPVGGVLVRLSIVLAEDSLQQNETEDTDSVFTSTKDGIRNTFITGPNHQRRLQSITAFARTDKKGKFSFNGLSANHPVVVLPLQPGFEFGKSQGVFLLSSDVQFFFKQQPNTIKLFSTKDFNNLKREKSLIVRTPGEAIAWFWSIAFIFFAVFWLLHVWKSSYCSDADPFVIPLLKIFSGLSVLTLLSLQDPLRDRLLAGNTIFYLVAGSFGLAIVMRIKARLFTIDSSVYRLFAFKHIGSAANGWQWAVVAMSILVLTIFLGSGPEGSGVKVNLLGFQPSELVKYLVVIFLAGYFSVNERFIAAYSSWSRRLPFFYLAICSIGVTIFLFLLLGDLGPAMVVCFTFIILFSFSRGDFASMMGGVIFYVVLVWMIKEVWLATAIAMVVLWLYMKLRKLRLSESTVMALVLLAGFMLVDQVPFLSNLFPGPVQRLADRKAIWQDPWNNEVYGGDQVANGIWALAGGGVTGQGIGNGHAKAIPEAHTDMILPSIAEELGWAAIASIFLLFFLYLHRSITIGRQTGNPFLFYVCSGIGISTFIQFVLIAGGSTGALPLSGVALPFVSYGGSSLLLNFLAAGFLLSASLVKGTPAQMKYITRQHDGNVLPALLAACVAISLLLINVSVYLFNNKKWVVEPALVADKNGGRMFSYNPRINMLMTRLQAGNLLDRNGYVVATSQVERIIPFNDSLVSAGISKEEIETLMHQRSDRYYPFGSHMFFWTGDANSGVFNGSPNGYFAEYRHAAELRGFPSPTSAFLVSASKFKPGRFLPEMPIEMSVVKRDYSALAPLLLAGLNSREVDKFKSQNRDVQLTMDAMLQTQLNNALANDDSVKLKRASVVILEDNTGDVLASASYPLAPVNNYDLLTLNENELNKMPGWNVNRDMGFTYASQPGSTAKLVTAVAAFNKLGEPAATLTKRVMPQDLIRTRGPEPDEAGNISMERAIVRSNNAFFIRLANEERLQEYMGDIYLKTGMFLRGVGGYYYEYEGDDFRQQKKWKDLWRNTEFKSVEKYNPGNIKPSRSKGVSGMSWGQGELVATPASVARVAAAIANNGRLMQSRFLLSVAGKTIQGHKSFQLTSVNAAGHLKTYMKAQSAGKMNRLHMLVAGKTGTPERIWQGLRIKDGWYVFFAPKAKGTGHIVTCIRMENAKGSSEAVRLAGEYVIPLLLRKGYIKSFEDKKVPVITADSLRTRSVASPLKVSSDQLNELADTVE